MGNSDMGGVTPGARYPVDKFDAIDKAWGQSPTPTEIDAEDIKLGPELEAHYVKGALAENPLGRKPYGTLGDVDSDLGQWANGEASAEAGQAATDANGEEGSNYHGPQGLSTHKDQPLK